MIVFSRYGFDCCRKVVKKHKLYVTEHTSASVDAAVNILHHSCIVDIDASFVMSDAVLLVLTYCEVLSFEILLLLYGYVCCNLCVTLSYKFVKFYATYGLQGSNAL